MAKFMKIARRGFLFGSLAIAGGVAFGWWKYKTPYGNPLLENLATDANALTPYVLIDAKGIKIIAPRAEMGQGIHTTLAALVAEEMELRLDQVQVIHGPASAAYFNAAVLREGVPFAPTDESFTAETMRAAMAIPAKFLGLQITGGSSSIPDAFDKMRLAGACAREALLQAAAQHFDTPRADLTAKEGDIHSADGRSISYIELAAEAAKIDLAAEPALKDPSAWTILGKSQKRVDMLGKSTGTATYTADLRLPNMRFASVKTSPRRGAMLSYNAEAAQKMAGVEKIIPLKDGVAVVANSTWTAFQALNLVTFDWAPAPYPATSAEISAKLTASLHPDFLDSTNRNDGDVEAALMGDVFEADYTVPYLAHATMEPMTAAAHLADGKLTVWAGNQLPTQILAEGAKLTGLPSEAITVQTMLMGGGFGRRAEMDVIRQAITIAQAMQGTPILLTWTREEDMIHDAYRPAAIAKVRAKLDGDKIQAFDFATVSSSVVESQAGRLGFSIPGPDGAIVQGAWEQPYRFANHRVSGYRAPAMVPVGSWRSVGASQNAFFHESAIDELAHLAKADPLDFRLRQIDHDPSRAVLKAVAEMAGWGQPMAGRAQGIAFCLSFGVPSAQVIEVEMTDKGLRLTKAWAAVDVGTALDPRNIQAQVSGAMIYALTAAINGEITFADGEAEQQTFWDYAPLRMPQAPQIEVQVLESKDPIRGIGEPGTPPAAPALANAIFALTGQRLRDLPFSRSITFV